MSYREKALGGLVFGLFAATPMIAAQISVPNVFTAGEEASAEAVNENFATLADGLSEIEQTMTSLQDTVSELENRLEELEDSDVFEHEDFLSDLEEFLDVHYTAPTDTAVQGPILRLTGANFQVINAAEQQTEPDGTGNIVVGFSQARDDASDICSNGEFDIQSDCEAEGFIWAEAHNSGSHNFVGGSNAGYSQTGGLVLGSQNAVNRELGAAIAGYRNTASGEHAAVLGGHANLASGEDTTVSGGGANEAWNFVGSVSGGWNNDATSVASSVSGGRRNIARGAYTSILGGTENETTSTANRSSISGGSECHLTEDEGWGAIESDGTALGDC